jgi:Flp pilus assembly protein TadD
MHDTQSRITWRARHHIIALGMLLSALLITYSNHFQNTFHFDDVHVVQSNIFIQSLENIPLFFKDPSTYSSVSRNQQYRPMVSVSLAIDYWLAKGPAPFWYHASTLFWYSIQCVLMYSIVLKIINISIKHRFNPYVSLIIVAWYALHTANAETINYISARSDSLSTCWVIIALAIFIHFPRHQKWGFYLIPFIIASLFKQTAIVFPALLTLYALLFDKKASFGELINVKTRAPLYRSLIASTGACWVTALMLGIFLKSMDPATYTPGGDSIYRYIITQPFVLFHYISNFILPVHLALDADWPLLSSMIDDRFFIGVSVIILMMWAAIASSKHTTTRPITFGILWFFIALLPTSSIIPLADAMNDHRMFFPCIGLALSVVYSLYYDVLRHEKWLEQNHLIPSFFFLSLLIISAYAYGTYQRNNVWRTEESLWHDAAIKYPQNARALMAYGIALMQRNQDKLAEHYFLQARQYAPDYSYIYVQLGLLNQKYGRNKEAEQYFDQAVTYAPDLPNVLYHYALFHLKNHPERAEQALLKILNTTPAELQSRYLLMALYLQEEAWDALEQQAIATLRIAPQNETAQQYLQRAKTRTSLITSLQNDIDKQPTAEKYLQLSRYYYEQKQYHRALTACKKALKIDVKNAETYNMMCVTYSQLQRYEQAKQACIQALIINPDLMMAQENLRFNEEQLKHL